MRVSHPRLPPWKRRFGETRATSLTCPRCPAAPGTNPCSTPGTTRSVPGVSAGTPAWTARQQPPPAPRTPGRLVSGQAWRRCRRRWFLRRSLATSRRCSAHSARHWATSSTPASTTSGHACAMWCEEHLPLGPVEPVDVRHGGRIPDRPQPRWRPLVHRGRSGPPSVPAGPEWPLPPVRRQPQPWWRSWSPWSECQRSGRGGSPVCGDGWRAAAPEVVAEPSR